ncbi:MAG: histidine kinase [Clostridiales bacterium]|nr:histidine kinase [Clostridiales bacterium]
MHHRRIAKPVVGAFFAVLVLCAALSAYIEYGRRAREDDQMRFIASTVSAQAYEVLSAQLNKAKTLEAFVVQNEGGTEGFERVARLLVTDSSVRNVLLAPGGVVSDVYPLKGNESVLGHDLTGVKAGDKEAQTAIDRGTMIMAGPFTLVQGGLGIAGRLPVYLDGTFWGIVSVTLNYPDALSGLTAPDTVAAQGFACRIWRINPDTGIEQTITQSGEGIGSRAFDYAFPIYNSEWHVTVAPIQPWYTNASVLFSALVSVLLSFSVAAGVSNTSTIRRMEQEAAESRILGLQKQLEYDRTNVLLTQISSHFFYHTLNAIQALIVLDPDAAYKMTEDFSRFLRFKVDSVSAENGLVPFREELRTVRAYAEINRIQLQGRLAMEYDVFDADFLIPVLTVQPVVENAIIHGIKPKVGGGTVRVSLSREEGFYVVRVSDDGVGYTPGGETSDHSVGISNIRARMNSFPGCTVEVESEPGRGTAVSLRYADNLGKEST